MRRLEIDHTKNITLSSSVTQVKLPIKERFVCSSSFDDLVCLLHHWDVPILAPNFLREDVLLVYCDQSNYYMALNSPPSKFQQVWLYNSQEFDDVTTTCEVFDFSTNAWRGLIQ
ncbi:PREDICTED: F-box protein At5g10340-like isoform X2 [Brassica oleracea var. oleracea]|uniref:F-box protein At5g10340-like isoform X2 n=1 Tax=Brassica oleracea var. oleracea TaxID=109376 RepID=UPI0006A71B8B|nr:PREDICTED: F-box protein At5g10340-like isoform X2 [Brassica oleracea var. oleracea]